ncbi:hypothetical protein LIER_34278 [Lithospermum erythrorhizon]|uniref:Reverse transcriptase domain-containing protein n=1 Tax=Lithospermum erythrorhizon TaxID=34254 RepID=A0AAV3S210_LITER
MRQFRPISLCNVPKRSIVDNIIMAYEIHHFIKKKTSGKKEVMSLKLDMEKAYDRVEWAYLRAVMTKLNFPVEWISLVMSFVESVHILLC